VLLCHTVAFHHKSNLCGVCGCMCVWCLCGVCVFVIMRACMYENNINRDTREIGCGDVNLTNLFQCRVHCIDSALWKWLYHVGLNV
jgi:hypothetical protein